MRDIYCVKKIMTFNASFLEAKRICGHNHWQYFVDFYFCNCLLKYMLTVNDTKNNASSGIFE